MGSSLGRIQMILVADIPFIAKKFGSKVIGSRTTTNIALTVGVDKSQLVTINGGENLDFKDFSVQVIESTHGGVRRSGRILRSKFEEITKPCPGRSGFGSATPKDLVSQV
jgi:hypothetical protein